MRDEELIERGAWNIDLILRDMGGDASARHILRIADNRIAMERLRDLFFERVGASRHEVEPQTDGSIIAHFIVQPGPKAARDALDYLRKWLMRR